MKWADGAALRAELTSQVDSSCIHAGIWHGIWHYGSVYVGQVEALLGPKTEDDLKPVDKKKAKPAATSTAPAGAASKVCVLPHPAAVGFGPGTDATLQHHIMTSQPLEMCLPHATTLPSSLVQCFAPTTPHLPRLTCHLQCEEANGEEPEVR